VVTRVAKVSRDLDGRTSAARRGIERRLAALEGAVRSRLHIAGSEDVASVKAQLAALTHRLERLEARLGTASADLHD
jgi:BMFP domain-containing protein YqiC